MSRKKFKIKKIISFSAKGFARALDSFFQYAPWVTFTLATVAVFWGVRSLLYADPGLQVSRVLVQPEGVIDERTLDQLSHKIKGRNILSVDLNRIENELGRNPVIQSVEVRRQFPSQIHISVKDRKPVGLLKWNESGPYGVLAEDGAIVDIYPQKASPMVVIEAYALGFKKVSVGQKPSHEALSECIRFIQAYEESSYPSQETLSKILIDKHKNIAIVLGDGPAIRLGRRPADRIHQLEKAFPILKNGDRLSIEYVDLQFEDMVVKRKSPLGKQGGRA